ncbi:fused MFS/spermidine synthase [Paucibacter sp. R3-3]|uniref:Fused MFS/spermidine synthase n=1 Tax=Roseateles agri TaxID=3098619 RepID=A0ABU5DEX0_9BURK|nr:fused MFS/spermidine synthase [Paucibacter sp. R3-3]MDY0743712.1 fused MFS/spermidine synthase [Paucibacter sp. R3-3]
MTASGFAGLGYQIVWTQQGALWLGHEAAAVLAVVAAFFGGLALGALALGPRIERSARPRHWYAGCELLIAAWGLVLIFGMAPFSAWAARLIGEQPAPAWQWTVAFLGSFALLLPATAAMGATLPAMERLVAAEGRRSIALLYAFNTFGAVLGVLATAFWLVPEWGLARTAGLCVALNLFCAAAAWKIFPASSAVPAGGDATARGPLLRLFATGLLGIGYEVLVVRVLSQVAEDTVYTFALLLAVYLVGSALGAAAWARWLRGRATRDALLTALATTCLLGTASLWAADALKLAVTSMLPESMAGAVAGEAALAIAAFLLPTLAMGALFSQLADEANAGGAGFGRALGFNTAGAALAPLLFGVLLAPMLGPKLCLLLVAAGYLAMVARPMLAALPAGAAAALVLFAPPLAFVDLPEGGRIVSYADGAMAAVSVVEDAQGVSRLRINNRQQEGSSTSRLVDARQALLPLLLHPAPQHALFLGLGTGVTAASAAQDPTLTVDAVELLPEVIAASAHFTEQLDPAPRALHMRSADARRYVRAAGQRYDVIVSDNFHPARSGSGSLYTVEHFAAVRERLADGGLFCQWLPLHQLDLETLRSIVRSFVAVYPQGTALLASNSLATPVLGLVSHAGFDATTLRRRIETAAWPEPPADFGIEDEYALLGSFVAGPTALRAFAGDAPANTDDRPVVAYRAPRITYAPDAEPQDRLIALLGQVRITPTELTGTDSPRLAAYWSARQRYLDIGRGVRPSADVRQMLAQLQRPLLEVLHTSPDFRPAYDPLLRMAMALGPMQPTQARALLGELAQVQPARSEARQALADIAD